MGWMKLDDQFHASRKINAIPKRHRFQAAGLWAIAGSWVAGQETDGFVPDYMIKAWGPTPKTIEALVDVDLWDRTDGGYQFHRWLDYNPSKADSERDRASARKRKKASRERRKAERGDDSGDESTHIQATNVPTNVPTFRPQTDAESTHIQATNRRRIEHESTMNRARIDAETIFNNSDTAGHDGYDETCHGVTPPDVTKGVTKMSRVTGSGVSQRPDPTRPDPAQKRGEVGDQSHPRATARRDSPSGVSPAWLAADAASPRPDWVRGTVDDPRCPTHEHLAPDAVPACTRCRRARDWLEAHEATVAEAERDARRAARDTCPVCHGDTIITLPDGRGWRCPHDGTTPPKTREKGAQSAEHTAAGHSPHPDTSSRPTGTGGPF